MGLGLRLRLGLGLGLGVGLGLGLGLGLRLGLRLENVAEAYARRSVVLDGATHLVSAAVRTCTCMHGEHGDL